MDSSSTFISSRYCRVRLVNMTDLKKSNFPMTPSQLDSRIKKLTSGGRAVLTHKLIFKIEKGFLQLKTIPVVSHNT